MTIADKARRAADFFTRTTSLAGEWSGDDLQQFFTVPEQVFTAEEMIAFAEDRGWQDHVPDAGNMVDGVEWEVKTINSTMIGNLSVAVRNEPDGSHSWTVWDNEDWDGKPLAEGTAPTREEARRQAVEAARGMG